MNVLATFACIFGTIFAFFGVLSIWFPVMIRAYGRDIQTPVGRVLWTVGSIATVIGGCAWLRWRERRRPRASDATRDQPMK